MIRLEDLDYALPPHYIAQQPCEPRDAARLLVYQRSRREIQHSRVAQILRSSCNPVTCSWPTILASFRRGWRARGNPTGGKVEMLLLRARDAQVWEALVKPSQRLRPGARVLLASGGGQSRDTVEIGERLPGGKRLVRFYDDPNTVLARHGLLPLPPYIHEPLADPDRYQTTYARVRGSAAAPTAGLHFTPELVSALEAIGVGFAFITLHIGLDTFQPIREADPLQHAIHSEHVEVPDETVKFVREAKRSNRRVIAVGTTSVRALESAVDAAGEIQPYTGETRLYIYPGYRFRAVDGMMTNFHLPRSTLLLLVAAFTGLAELKRIYATAIEEKYRFYSFGDASLLL